jgi:hypothetical protein
MYNLGLDVVRTGTFLRDGESRLGELRDEPTRLKTAGEERSTASEVRGGNG